jgi:hypothetical protein
MKNREQILKKLFYRKEVAELLDNTANVLDARLLILGDKGNILANIGRTGLGADICMGYPVVVNGERIALIKGNKNAAVVANFINYIVGMEFDKRDLIGETLKRYKEINLFYDYLKKIQDVKGD